jgi:hypothetical protein
MRTTAFDAALFHRRHRSVAIDPSPTLRLRLRVYLTRGMLDRRIATGSACESSAALALRAAQLIDPRTRRQTARALYGIVEYVERVGSRPAFTAVVVDRRAVRSSRHAILGLAERLEGGAPAAPRGVALARMLLTDGIGPLFNANSRQTAIEAIWSIGDALEDGELDAIAVE